MLKLKIMVNDKWLMVNKHVIARVIGVCLLLCLGLVACKHGKQFPPEPHLEFVSLEKIDNGTGIDNQAILKLKFTDGDGNLGLDANEIYPPFDAPPYDNNFFVKFYVKRNGEFVVFSWEYNGVTHEWEGNARLPRFLATNDPEPIEGVIEKVLEIRNPLNLPTIPAVDTVMFECWLVDRDLNESNHVFTPVITVVNR